MSSKALKTVGKAAIQRVSGSRVGMFRAQVVAAIVGVGAAVVTYRALRSG